MQNSAPELVSEIKQIYAQYIAEVGAGGYKVWPKSIRDRALLLSDVVGSCKKAAELSGLSVETIYQWRAEVKKSQSFKMLPVVERSTKSVTVTDPGPKFSKIKAGDAVTVTVTTPQGFVIAGLDTDQVLEILLKLGAK